MKKQWRVQPVVIVFTDDDDDEFPVLLIARKPPDGVMLTEAESICREAIESGSFRPAGDLRFSRFEPLWGD